MRTRKNLRGDWTGLSLLERKREEVGTVDWSILREVTGQCEEQFMRP